MAEAVSGSSDTKTCSRCGTIGSGKFCPDCGNAFDAVVKRGGWRPVVGVIFIAALLYVTFVGIPTFNLLGVSAPELTVEVKPLRTAPNEKYGYVTITNLSKETVTVTHVSINRSSEPACSFNPKNASYETPILTPGKAITMGTVAMEAGFCGSIFIVSVDTDKGSSEFKMNWQ